LEYNMRNNVIILRKVVAIFIAAILVCSAPFISSNKISFAEDTIENPTIAVMDNSVYSGNTAYVYLYGSNLQNLCVADLFLIYDTSTFTYVDGYLYDKGTGSNMSLNAQDDALHISLANTSGISGNGYLLCVYFSVSQNADIKDYTFRLAVSEAKSCDPNNLSAGQQDVNLTKVDGTIKVLESNAVSNSIYFNSNKTATALTVGESLTYYVYSSYLYSLSAGNVDFIYDDEYLTLDIATYGAIFNNTYVLINTNNSGVARYTFAKQSGCLPNYYGFNEMFVLTFTAKKAGNANISFSASELISQNSVKLGCNEISDSVVIVDAEDEEQLKVLKPRIRDNVDDDKNVVVDIIIDEGAEIGVCGLALSYDYTKFDYVDYSSDDNNALVTLNSTLGNGLLKIDYIANKRIEDELTLVSVRLHPKSNEYLTDVSIQLSVNESANFDEESINLDVQNAVKTVRDDKILDSNGLHIVSSRDGNITITISDYENAIISSQQNPNPLNKVWVSFYKDETEGNKYISTMFLTMDSDTLSFKVPNTNSYCMKVYLLTLNSLPWQKAVEFVF